MGDTLQYLVSHGYLVLFASVLAQQIGVPLPSIPFIVAAGALAHTGQLSFGSALFVAFSAAMIVDLVWFEIGRRRGTR
jgi:membrane protein DedA with SNARE-associated domain